MKYINIYNTLVVLFYMFVSFHFSVFSGHNFLNILTTIYNSTHIIFLFTLFSYKEDIP